MRGFNTYRHISCTDIDMFVHKVNYRGPAYIKVKGTLVNRFNGERYETKTFKILKDELKKWKIVCVKSA